MFEFVSYQGPALPKDKKVRTTIHLKAMQHNAALRKQRNGYSKKNTRQIPQWMDMDEPPMQTDIIVLTPPPQDPHTVTLSQRFPILNYAAPLTVLHVGFSNFCYIKSDFSCIGLTLAVLSTAPLGSQDLEKRRLFSHIPSRYGHHLPLTYATDCVVARLEHIIRLGGKWCAYRDRASLPPYIKALRSLQEALADEKRRMEPETLCAVELLGIFELLSGTRDGKKWKHHADGASKLFEMRGPDRFTTEFDLSLFIAHAGSIISVAFLSGRDCFLAESQWLDVIETAVRSDPVIPTDQIHLVLQIWRQLVNGPNAFRKVEDFIRNPGTAQERCEIVSKLATELGRLQEWAIASQRYTYGEGEGEWQGLADSASRMLQIDRLRIPALQQSITWCILQGSFLLCCMIKTRLLFALAPRQFAQAEVTCQAIARTIASAKEVPVTAENEKLMNGLFMSEVAWMSKAVLDSADAWTDASAMNEGSKILNKGAFKKWCIAMGREVDY